MRMRMSCKRELQNFEKIENKNILCKGFDPVTLRHRQTFLIVDALLKARVRFPPNAKFRFRDIGIILQILLHV
jgi:hypothetical protein